MSTILDALRKAQEETGGGRNVRADEIPASGTPEPPAESRRGRPRRALVWLAGILAILGLAFVGGLALGNRVSELFTGTHGANDAEETVAAGAPAPSTLSAEQAAAQVAAQVAATQPAPAQQAERAAANEEPARVASAAQRPPTALAAAPAPGGAAAPVPTPYGKLHVFGADEAPVGKDGNEDRAARLQQLREKMLKARREAAEHSGPRGAEPPAPIVVPPPRPPAAAPAAEDVAAVARRADVEAARAALAQGAAAMPAEVAPEPEVANGDASRPAVAAAEPSDREAPEPAREVAVGVSVQGAHQEATEGEIRDPDIPPMAEPGGVDVKHPAAHEAPAAVASLPPQEAAPAGSPPVLRRSPGGAPQVAINILQWSAEPGRRFAFVSVDGGGMTQVREGDRIGGLTVKHIHQQMIEFGFNDSTFLLRAN